MPRLNQTARHYNLFTLICKEIGPAGAVASPPCPGAEAIPITALAPTRLKSPQLLSRQCFKGIYDNRYMRIDRPAVLCDAHIVAHGTIQRVGDKTVFLCQLGQFAKVACNVRCRSFDSGLDTHTRETQTIFCFFNGPFGTSLVLFNFDAGLLGKVVEHEHQAAVYRSHEQFFGV